MGYAHIRNLYKDQSVLLFKEVFALEKIHGTSAHVSWQNGDLKFFSGGESYHRFKDLFNQEDLRAKFAEKFGDDTVFVYGEAYGGKQQGMKLTYGDKLRFIVFDVKIGDVFLDVPAAEEIAKYLGLEFVDYVKIPCNLAYIDYERDRPSYQATRNGCSGNTDRFGFCPPIREGVVLRPLHECAFNNGARVIAKHKRPEFSERKTAVPVDDAKRALMESAQAIADEWVTEMRLSHVLDKLGNPAEMSSTGRVIDAMIEDVTREAEGEIADTPEVRKAIGAAAAKLFKRKVSTVSWA